jgi:small subunit ribosomal protein S8
MDPISDMITIIRNGYLARRRRVTVPHSRLNRLIAEKILELGYLESVVFDEKEKVLLISLRYEGDTPRLDGIERISKLSLRVYSSTKEIPRVLGGRGEVILSTPKGILSGAEAKKNKTGGELLLKIW